MFVFSNILFEKNLIYQSIEDINRTIIKYYYKLSNDSKMLCCKLWRPKRKRFRASHTDKSTAKQSPASAVSTHLYILPELTLVIKFYTPKLTSSILRETSYLHKLFPPSKRQFQSFCLTPKTQKHFHLTDHTIRGRGKNAFLSCRGGRAGRNQGSSEVTYRELNKHAVASSTRQSWQTDTRTSTCDVQI